MNGARFRYALEPVLLTRRWALEALLHSLAEHNAQLADLMAQEEALKLNYRAAIACWQALTAVDEAQPGQQFGLTVRYLGELALQLRTLAGRMADLAAARDELAVRVVSAQRAVEAAEKHRGAMKDHFIRQRLSADFKLADDQWNTLQTGAASHDH